MRRTLAVLVLLLSSISLFADEPRDPARYVKLLIPVYVPVPVAGANGAQWATTLWLRNDGDLTLDAFPLSRECVGSFICAITPRENPAFAPHHTGFHLSPYQTGPFTLGALRPNGTFLYVERERAAQLSAHLDVADLSRVPPRSAELPLVFEDAFFTTTRSILGVTFMPGARITLRVYDADARDGAEVMVRLYEMGPRFTFGSSYDGPKLLGERRVTLHVDPESDKCGFPNCTYSVHFAPAVAILGDLRTAIPELASAREQPFGLRIEIEPATDGLRYWPLVTVTDDATSMVSVFTVR